MLDESNKPLVVFGQGIRTANAIKEFETFLHNYQYPAICSRMSFDILDFENPYFFGMGGMRGHKAPSIMMKEADTIIVLAVVLLMPMQVIRIIFIIPTLKLSWSI